jgi:ribosomal peptide maturation radical SAM protein 1
MRSLTLKVPEPKAAGGSVALSIVLVQMPWATVMRPSIALGILKQICAEESIEAPVLYPNLDLAAELGYDEAKKFSDDRMLFGLSEHLFAADLFGPAALDSDEYLQAAFAQSEFEQLQTLRDTVVPAFLEHTAQRILALEPDVVGFTATFNQAMPSLALAARLKRGRPQLEVIVGGASFDGEMGPEYHRALPHLVDHVFIGEAEEPFREYLRRKRDGRPTAGIAGTTSFVDGAVLVQQGRPLTDMDASPSPDYDDFFAERERVKARTGIEFELGHIPFESSRGCWWGAKNQCTFCGINPEILGFRHKKLDTVIADIVGLSARYGSVRLTATDWILSRWHCDELFRRLAELELDLQIFYELRADLSKAQIARMRAAGIVEVQPGIESFSTDVLKLMRKGTSRIRHVQFLRWSREYGINAAYNILCGFPNEHPEWYEDMAAFMPDIGHLQPPQTFGAIELHRFSPLFQNGEEFGVDARALRPEYQHNFPPGMVDPDKIGYFFEFSSALVPEATAAREAVAAVVTPWLAAWEAHSLPVYEYSLGPDFVSIADTRPGRDRTIRLSRIGADVVLLCDAVQSLDRLRDDLRPLYPNAVADGTLELVIDDLLESGVLMREANLYLTLPIGKKPRTTDELRRRVLGMRFSMEPKLGPDRSFAIA